MLFIKFITILVGRSFECSLHFFVTDAKKVSRELSLHPVHLTPDKEGNLPPSALVSFCSYQGESSLLGKKLSEMDNMTVCDKFQPTILECQLCYTLDVAGLVDVPVKSGKSNGLFLLLDPKPYRLNQTEKKALGSETGSGQKSKVFIHTLAQYTTFGSGSYAMSSLKKMTGTSNFKQLPDYQKKCLDHSREQCQTQTFLEQLHVECNCVPWALQTEQVEI